MKLTLRAPASWLEALFWFVITAFIIISIAWQFASGPAASFLTDQASAAPLQAPPVLKITLPHVPVPVRPPAGDYRILDAGSGPDRLIELPELVSLAKSLNSPETSAAEDLDVLHTLLDAFQRSQAWTGTPAAENEEFIAPLRGENPRHLVFIPPDHPALNDRGQLLDRWGTPYAFHPESSASLKIRSAGEDRVFHTADDVIAQ